jgi:L-alanine-DL-glutamate epimerase-like enolase superfamily enzyme
MSPNLIGRPVTGPLAMRRSMDKLLNGHNYAKTGIHIAIHDLIGKAHDMRVCDLLGDATSERVSSCYALTVDEPDEVARTAVEKVAEGYPCLQIKVGGRPVELDIETIRKVWEATGRTRLSVDANRALTTSDVVRIERECADIPFVFEQPCNTMEEVAAIRGQLRHGMGRRHPCSRLRTYRRNSAAASARRRMASRSLHGCPLRLGQSGSNQLGHIQLPTGAGLGVVPDEASSANPSHPSHSGMTAPHLAIHQWSYCTDAASVPSTLRTSTGPTTRRPGPGLECR